MNFDLESALLDRLSEATANGLIHWDVDSSDPNRDFWRSEFSGTPISVELIYVPCPGETCVRRFAVEVTCFGQILTAAVGTVRYAKVMYMLSSSMLGWQQAGLAQAKKLESAISQLDSALKKEAEQVRPANAASRHG